MTELTTTGPHPPRRTTTITITTTATPTATARITSIVTHHLPKINFYADQWLLLS